MPVPARLASCFIVFPSCRSSRTSSGYMQQDRGIVKSSSPGERSLAANTPKPSRGLTFSSNLLRSTLCSSISQYLRPLARSPPSISTIRFGASHHPTESSVLRNASAEFWDVRCVFNIADLLRRKPSVPMEFKAIRQNTANSGFLIIPTRRPSSKAGKSSEFLVKNSSEI